MATTLKPHIVDDERYVLHDVSWETYVQLLKNYDDRSVPRLNYDRGDLEIMSPSLPHEAASDILRFLVNVICEERKLDVIALGSVTHKRADLLKGVQPDGCFYIQNVNALRGIEDLDLMVHPPADLVIEVDLSRSSIARLPIYAALGVPEVWQYEEGVVTFWSLQDELYHVVPESFALPRITSEAVTSFVKDSFTMKRPEWLRAVRDWIRSIERETSI